VSVDHCFGINSASTSLLNAFEMTNSGLTSGKNMVLA